MIPVGRVMFLVGGVMFPMGVAMFPVGRVMFSILILSNIGMIHPGILYSPKGNA